MADPFVFKYIPKEFSEIVGVNTAPFQKMVEDPQSMPSILLYGPKGTGKTSIARILVKKLEPVSVLKINGSSERGIDTIRDKIEMFVSSASSVPGKPKIVWIEEMDNFSLDAFKAMRNLIEKYMKNSRFIGTANYIQKIPEEIQSRFTLYEFKKHTSKDVLPRARQICDLEQIRISDSVLLKLIDSCNGDIRSVVKNLQKLSFEGEEITEQKVLNMRTLTDIVYEKLFDGDWSYLRMEIPKENPDYTDLLVSLNDKFFESKLTVERKAKITDIISEALFKYAFSFDKDILASATFFKIIKTLRE